MIGEASIFSRNSLPIQDLSVLFGWKRFLNPTGTKKRIHANIQVSPTLHRHTLFSPGTIINL
jgi:hypothetical protein